MRHQSMRCGRFDHDQFERVLAYYGDSIAHDRDRSVLLQIDDEGLKFLPLRLKKEWALSGRGELTAQLIGENANFATELRQRSSSAEIMYGYPILARRDRKGRLELVPVFLQSVEHRLNGNALTARLIHDWPEINNEFLASIGGVSKRDGAYINDQLYEELGITADADLPSEGLSYFVRHLAKLPQLPKGEPVEPSCISSQPSLGEINVPGMWMLNRHALLITDRPCFTRGLEHELKSLSRESRKDRSSETALSYFFGAIPSSGFEQDVNDDPSDHITEVVPLNEEQRSAVKSAFRNDLTIVTGPPGTGKSQIVTTVIANAWLRQQSVLFASHNHKAVDVVEDRVNRLSSRPLMIRTGRPSGDRKLRNEIINFMSNILSSDVSDHDRLELNEARREVGQLEKNRASIWRYLEDLRTRRNHVDQLDKEILKLKSEQAKLDERFAAAHQSREQDKIHLDGEFRNIQEKVEKLCCERDIAQNTRDGEIASINLEIQELQSAIECLQSRSDKDRIDHPRVDADVGAEIARTYRELDSLKQEKEQETRTCEAKIASLKRRFDLLGRNFDRQRWDRQKGRDFNVLRITIRNAHCTLTAEADNDGSILARFWKRWRRSARLERIAHLTDAWADEYDILGKPPAKPIVASGLELWTRYTSDALTKLAEWERDAERNYQLAKQIDELDDAITKVETEFQEKEFDLREAQLNQSLSDQVRAQTKSLNEHIDHHHRQITEINEVFERKEFDKRIAHQRNEVEHLSTAHEAKHGAKLAELNALQDDIGSNLRDKSSEFDDTAATLAKMPMVNDLAAQLKRVENQLWNTGKQLVDASMRMLPDRFDDDTRRAIGDFRALFERLADDQVSGQVYRELMREMESLFPKVMSALPAWCVTNLSARGNIPFHAGMFDLVVIDEASQCNIPSALPLLYRAKRALIIGDPNQLRHITKISTRQDQMLQAQHGLDSASDQSFSFKQQSLFDIAVRNAGRKSLHSLREHFRSHADIISFSNQHWYDDRLLVCTDYNELQIPTGQKAGIRWHKNKGRVERSSTYNGNINREEAEELSEQVVDLIANRGFRGSVGIVTPFRAQANLIRSIINERLNPADAGRCELITDTAHAFQGDEKDVVFFSPCVEFQMPSGAEWFITATDNLFNVAITRPRALLVVVGNLEACLASNIPHVKGFAELSDKTLKGKDAQNVSSGFVDGPNVGYWERDFYDALVAAGLKPMHQYREGQYRLDFAFVSDNLKLNVEVDGEMYHREWDGSRSRGDLMRDHRLIGMGWQIKRFWAFELRDDMERCIAEIKALLREGNPPCPAST